VFGAPLPTVTGIVPLLPPAVALALGNRVTPTTAALSALRDE